jgi:hypothetical protein
MPAFPRRIRSVFPLVVLPVFLLACAGEDGAAPDVAWPDWSAPAATIGALDTPVQEVFGEIAAVAIGPDERIHVFDEQASDVRVFTPSGRLVARFGGAGGGPRELHRPVSLAVGPSGRTFVGLADRSVKIFSAAAPDAIPDRLQLPVMANTLCTLDDLLVAQGANIADPGVIWIHALDGSPVRSFGAKAPAPTEMLSLVNSLLGILACAPAGLVAYLSAGDSVLHAFDLHGAERWRATIPGWRPNLVTVTDNGGYSVRMPEGGNTILQALLPWDQQRLLMQVAVRTRAAVEAGDRWAELRSFFVSTADGAVSELPADIPHVAATSARHVVGIEVDPYPRLLVWERPR